MFMPSSRHALLASIAVTFIDWNWRNTAALRLCWLLRSISCFFFRKVQRIIWWKQFGNVSLYMASYVLGVQTYSSGSHPEDCLCIKLSNSLCSAFIVACILFRRCEQHRTMNQYVMWNWLIPMLRRRYERHHTPRSFFLLYLSRLHKTNTYAGNKSRTKQFPRKAKARAINKGIIPQQVPRSFHKEQSAKLCASCLRHLSMRPPSHPGLLFRAS
jgi:hypothetical protein